MTQVTLDVLHHATADEATRFFAETDAEALVEVVRSAEYVAVLLLNTKADDYSNLLGVLRRR